MILYIRKISGNSFRLFHDRVSKKSIPLTRFLGDFVMGL